jgi:hypothetical protein
MSTYFSISEANKILPTVIKKFNHSKMLKNKLIKIEQQIGLDLTSKISMGDYTILKQKLNTKVTEFYKSIEDLESLGVVLKGLDQGLLDFPSKRFDEEIWLCWKEGESEIKFWHEKDSGFIGRKPISVSNESLV